VKSLPMETEAVRSLIVTSEPLAESATLLERYQLSLEKYQATLAITRQILTGKHGAYELFFYDGLSKFYELCMDIVSKGRYLQGQVFDEKGDYTTRLYGHAHQLFRNYLTEIYMSNTPLFVATAWERLAGEDENASEAEKRTAQRTGQRVWLPAFPGQMGYTINGEFDWSIRAGLSYPQECDSCAVYRKHKETAAEVATGQHYTWQLKPRGDVQHVGVKGLYHIVPTYVHQSWPNLCDFILNT